MKSLHQRARTVVVLQSMVFIFRPRFFVLLALVLVALAFGGFAGSWLCWLFPPVVVAGFGCFADSRLCCPGGTTYVPVAICRASKASFLGLREVATLSSRRKSVHGLQL